MNQELDRLANQLLPYILRKIRQASGTQVSVGGQSITDAQIFQAVLSQDGAGSELDADTVDGYQAAALLDFDNHTDVPVSLLHMDAITAGARLFGGEITANGDGTAAVAAGAGLSKTGDAGPEDAPATEFDGQGSRPVYVEWDAVASLALTDNAYNYIYYDGSTASIKATTDFYSISFTQDFTLGRCYRSGTSVIVRLCGTNAWNFNRRVQLFGEEYLPVVRAKGMILGASGTRNIAITEGVLWAELVNRFTVDAFDSSGADRFTYWYRNGSGGWTSATDQAAINNTQYDDGDGTLGTLTANRYGVHWVYEVHDSSVHVLYGQGDYTLAQAEAATPPSSLPGLIAAYGTLVGKIIIQKSAAAFYSVQSAFTTTFTGSGVVDHGDLAGLADDDHTQYLLLAGRSGGQTVIGGTAAGDDLTLTSTSNATKGDVIISDRILAGGDVLPTGATDNDHGLNARLQQVSGPQAIGDYGYNPAQIITPQSWYLGSTAGVVADDFFAVNTDLWSSVAGCEPQFTLVGPASFLYLKSSSISDTKHAILQATISGHSSGNSYYAACNISEATTVDCRVGVVLMDSDMKKGAAWWIFHDESEQNRHLIAATYNSADAWLSQANAKTSSVAYTTDWTVRWTSQAIPVEQSVRLMYILSLRPATASVRMTIRGAAQNLYQPVNSSALGFAPAKMYLLAEGGLGSGIEPVLKCDFTGRITGV